MARARWAVAALTALLLLAGCSPSTTNVGSSVNLTSSGSSGSLGQKKLRVTVDHPATTGTAITGMNPGRGQYLTVNATVEYTKGSGGYTATPGDFQLVAANGTVYDTVTSPGSLYPTTLTVGRRSTGQLVFDVPSTIRLGSGAKIRYIAAALPGRPVAYWKV